MKTILKILVKSNYFTTVSNEVRKEQESGTEFIFAELKSTAFTPSFPLFFSTTVILAASGLNLRLAIIFIFK